MHPELLSTLAAERRRDLARPLTARTMPPGRGATPARARRPARRFTLPRYRVCWTGTKLAAVAGNRRGRSLVIVISATRTL